jgi:pimeloyl-ACP methyl ester carboxylesterase
VLLALLSHWMARQVERAFLPAGDWLELEGERIHYRTLGEGPPMVLVHGLGGQMRNFDYLPLQDLARRHRIVLMDRPGSGLSQRRDEAKAGIQAQGRLVAGFIRTLRFEQRPLLVGHSLGGAIALAVALQDPDCIAGLALIAPLTHYTPDIPLPFRALGIHTRWLRHLFAQVLAVPLGIAGGRATLAAVFAPEAPPQDFPQRGGAMLGLRPSAFIGSSTDMCAVQDDLPLQQERYGQLRLPVHVLYGDQDRILDWRIQGEGLRNKHAATRLELIGGAGHMLPVTQPARTAAWLEQVALECQR